MQSLCCIRVPSNPHACPPKREKPNLKLSSRTGLLKYMSPPLMAAVLTLSPLCCSTPGCNAFYGRSTKVTLHLMMSTPAAAGLILTMAATQFFHIFHPCSPPNHHPSVRTYICQTAYIDFTLCRNGVDTEEGLYGITYYGKGRMPGFGEKCMPRGQCTFGPRLQDEEIKLLASFVKLQAEKGWPNVAN